METRLPPRYAALEVAAGQRATCALSATVDIVDCSEPDEQSDLAQLGAMLSDIRSLIQRVDGVREAVVLVRRANAAGQLVDQALKNVRALEVEQFELRQDAAETHLRTQRAAGELLARRPKHRGGRPVSAGGTASTVEEVSRVSTLSELGVDTHESHRWQRIAGIPAELFERYVASARVRRRELTTRSVLRLAGRLRDAEAEHEDGQSPASGRQAVRQEYVVARRHAVNMLWLDPAVLADGMTPAQRTLELAHLDRLRLWIDEFEHALGRESS